MTEKTIYIACDGEEFDTAEECREYEENIKEMPGILCFDEKLHYLDPSEIGVEDAWKESRTLFIVNDTEAEKTIRFLDQYGCCSPDAYKTGDLLQYDPDNDIWVNMMDEYARQTANVVMSARAVYQVLQDSNPVTALKMFFALRKICTDVFNL